jgi:hypothetical protein
MSQNLVPDPGFEDWNGTIGQNPNTLGGLNLWYEVNGTPDHHHINNPPGSNLTSLDTTCATGAGQNQCGFPCEGLATLGAYKGNGIDGTKEWSAIALSEAMEMGTTYDISMWIQNKKDNPNFIMETNQWGMFFSESAQPAFDPDLINYDDYADHYVTSEEMIVGSDWTEVTWEYVAAANYTHIFVGYVGNVADAVTNAWSESGSVGFYTWIDKVSVVPQDVGTAIPDESKALPRVYPNPVMDFATIDLQSMPSGIIQAALLDRFGSRISIVELNGGQSNALNVEYLSAGTYLLRIPQLDQPIKIVKR